MIKVIDYPNGDHYDGQVRRLVEKVFTEEDDPLDEQEEEDPRYFYQPIRQFHK